MAEPDVTPVDQVAAATPADQPAPLTRIAAILLGLALILGGVNNEAVRLSGQLLPELPAPGVLALRVLVVLVGACLLAWGSGGLFIRPAWGGLRPRLWRSAPPAAARARPIGGLQVVAEDPTPAGITVRLRAENAIAADLQAKGQVDAVRIWFEVESHADLDVMLDRIVFSLWAVQPVLHGVMALRTPIPHHHTVSDILFEGALTTSAVEMIQKRQVEVRNGGRAQYTVRGWAYFDSAQGPFAVQLHKLQRDIPPV